MARKRSENHPAHKKQRREYGVETKDAASGPKRSLLSSIDPEKIVKALEQKKKKKSGQILQPIPPEALFDLIHKFLRDYRYNKAAHGLRTDHQKRPGHNYNLWVHHSDGYPDLLAIFEQWKKQNDSTIDTEAYARGQLQRAEEKKALKGAKKARLLQQTGHEPTVSDEAEASNVESTNVDEDESSDSDENSSDETSGSEIDDAMSVDEVVATLAVPAAAPPNKLKRKAASTSSSSSGSSSGESSESESDIEKSTAVVPVAKKLKVATPVSELSSSSSSTESESDSESDSSSSSSPSGIAVAKHDETSLHLLKTSAASKNTISKKVPSTDSSSSESSDASSDSEENKPKTTISTQLTSVSRSGSDSSATLPLSKPVALMKAPGSNPKDSPSSSSSGSDSSSSSSSSSDDDDPASSVVVDNSKKSSNKPMKEPKAPKDILIYHEPASKTQLKRNPLATGEQKTVEATASNFKNLKKQRIPFSRIPSDVKVDERFSSNKYVPYEYAEKAHQDLIVTKGKGFTKAKNKGKRGSYRGGPIDTMGVRAIKFDD